MIPEIIQAVADRGIRRLCHFTPSRNLQHIAAGKVGVLSTEALSADERASYNPTDLRRIDGHRGHVCCSIEYPNGWYFDEARNKEVLFPDWVILLISPMLLAADGTLFSPGNAARGAGRQLAPGFKAFSDLFANAVPGKNGNYVRTPNTPQACPTDQQAEVLIADIIPMAHILGVAVSSERQGLTERARLRANGLDSDDFKFVVAPYMFNKFSLSAAIKSGVKPPEPDLIPPESKSSQAE